MVGMVGVEDEVASRAGEGLARESRRRSPRYNTSVDIL